jgi:peptide/nickel transport system permease protein
MQQVNDESSQLAIVRPQTLLRSRIIRLARRQPLMMAGIITIVIVVFAAIIAPFIGLPDPSQIDVTQISEPPSKNHILGTDLLGQDMFSRLLHGARISLRVALFGVLLGNILGALIGLLSGYSGGWVDNIVQRFIEIALSIPTLLLAIVLLVVMGSGETTIIIAIAVVNVGNMERVLRAVTLSIKSSDFVTSARAIGAGWPRIILRHVAPGTLAAATIVVTTQIGLGIILEATLGFLGLGIPPQSPSWGKLVAEPFSSTLSPPWWLVVVPGATIAIVVLAFNLLGDGLRDELDPRMRGSQSSL